MTLPSYAWPGAIVGVVEERAALHGDRVRAGDVLLGYASNALHTVLPFFFGQTDASLRNWMSSIVVLLLFIAPMFTMRLIAEEKQSGTIELLLTSPLRDWELVIGKFLVRENRNISSGTLPLHQLNDVGLFVTEHLLAPDHIQGKVAGSPHDPRGGIFWNAVERPGLQSPG